MSQLFTHTGFGSQHLGLAASSQVPVTLAPEDVVSTGIALMCTNQQVGMHTYT